jgi:hypothetical protein
MKVPQKITVTTPDPRAESDPENVCDSCGKVEATKLDGLCDECREDDSCCPDCGDPTENGGQCHGCRSNERVRR